MGPGLIWKSELCLESHRPWTSTRSVWYELLCWLVLFLLYLQKNWEMERTQVVFLDWCFFENVPTGDRATTAFAASVSWFYLVFDSWEVPFWSACGHQLCPTAAVRWPTCPQASAWWDTAARREAPVVIFRCVLLVGSRPRGEHPFGVLSVWGRESARRGTGEPAAGLGRAPCRRTDVRSLSPGWWSSPQRAPQKEMGGDRRWDSPGLVFTYGRRICLCR